eukprot:7376798-Prymnesium_polylepis.2
MPRASRLPPPARRREEAQSGGATQSSSRISCSWISSSVMPAPSALPPAPPSELDPACCSPSSPADASSSSRSSSSSDSVDSVLEAAFDSLTTAATTLRVSAASSVSSCAVRSDRRACTLATTRFQTASRLAATTAACGGAATSSGAFCRMIPGANPVVVGRSRSPSVLWHVCTNSLSLRAALIYLKSCREGARVLACEYEP